MLHQSMKLIIKYILSKRRVLHTFVMNIDITDHLPKRIFRKVRPNKQRNVGPKTESGNGASESNPVTKSISSTFL